MKRDEYLKTNRAAKVLWRDSPDKNHERTTSRYNEGLIGLLLSCPVKGWFEPLDRTATTDHIELLNLR